MEKKDWEERLTSSFSYSMGEGEYFMIDGEETNIDDLKEFIQKELDKAREEELEWILKNCSGGGNWRRIVNQRLSKLKTKE